MNSAVGSGKPRQLCEPRMPQVTALSSFLCDLGEGGRVDTRRNGFPLPAVGFLALLGVWTRTIRKSRA